MKLHKLIIRNLKGIKSFTADFAGQNITVRAENGKGKTTIYDAFLWLFFGKDSAGRKDFSLRPLDDDNKPVGNVVVVVEASIKDAGGRSHTFRKEERERCVKGQIRGYTTSCWIDEVPKKLNEYQKYIAATVISEDTFKLLTDLAYFNEKLHWSQRRETLVRLVGNVGEPEGFDELAALLNGRSIDDYRKVVNNEKAGYIAERDEIGPRIDEKERDLVRYAQSGSEPELIAERDMVVERIAALSNERKDLLDAEQAREDARRKVNNLKTKKIERETFLAADTSPVKAMLDEKAEIEAAFSKQKAALSGLSNKLELSLTAVTSAENELAQSALTLKSIKDEYTAAEAKPKAETCYMCGQPLPSQLVADNERKRCDALSDIINRGNKLKREINAKETVFDNLRNDANLMLVACEKAEKDLREKEAANKTRLAEIDALIEAAPRTAPADDRQWTTIVAEIEKAEKEIGEPVSDRLDKIEARRASAETERDKLNAALNEFDTAAKAKRRIEELNGLQATLSQSIADCDRRLSRLDAFKKAESQLITDAVNGMFHHVEFKLFKELLNGELEHWCEATFGGVPYRDMSTGQKIICGVDIVNVLGGHYGVSAPLFIDHAESITLPLGAEMQTIRLYAATGIADLQVTADQAREKVV